MSSTHRSVRAGVLEIAYEESGDLQGVPVILSHGFPYDVRAYDAVVGEIAQWARVIVPYLRGYGPTRFVSAQTLRSGEQAALGADLLALMDALAIERAILGGYDWGGRASCIVAAVHPERVLGLVTCGGYNIQNIPRAHVPTTPQREHRIWYQYYLHGERGRTGLTEHRDAFCRHLWETWSPAWNFDDATFADTAASFANPDFVDVVVHSYRHRFALVAGDPAYATLERALEGQPRIDVPAIALDGDTNGIYDPDASVKHVSHFARGYETRSLPGIGHNVPQESPHAFAAALAALHERSETA